MYYADGRQEGRRKSRKEGRKMEGWTDGWMDEQTDKGENEKLLKIMEQLPTSPGSGAARSVV